MTTGDPGFHHHSIGRTTFRVIGAIAVAAALVLVGVALVDFVSAMASQDIDARPGKIWMFFAGVPLLVVGGLCLNAGYGGRLKRHTLTARRVAVAPVRCPTCGANADKTARFCASCGQPFARSRAG